MEPLLGAGHGHVAQPPLLLHLLGLADGPNAGEDPLLHADHKDHGEFQPLGSVHGHHHHAVLAGVVVVQIGIQGNGVQEARQGGLPLRILYVAVDGGQKLPHVFQPGPVLHRVLGLQHDGIAGPAHHLLVEVRQGQLHRLAAQTAHQIGKLSQPGGGLLELGVGPGVPDDLPHRAVLRRRDGLGPLDGGGPDPPGRVVEDAHQPQVVGGVVHRAQVGQHVLDLRPVEEPGAADDAVGHAVALEGLLNLVGLGVHPVEHCVVLPAAALGEIPQDLGRHVLGLVALVHGGVDLDLVAGGVVGPQLLALAALVVADHRVGGPQDVLGGAVVLLQPDDPGPLILVLKGEDVLDGGPPEAVDGLVVVAHHADVLPFPRQQGGQLVLEVVGVLILVDEHIAELVLVVTAHVLKVPQQTHRVQDQVVEVQGVGLPEAALILHVDPGDLGQAEIPRLFALGQVLRSGEHGILGPGDGGEHRPGGKGLIVDALVLQHILDHPLGVGGVVDGEGAVKAQLLDVPAQNLHAGGVEGGGPHVVGGGAQHPLQPLLQLPGRLVCEGDGDDGPGHGGLQLTQPFRLRFAVGERVGGIGLQKGQVVLGHPAGHLVRVRAPAVFHQIGDAVDEHGGLAATRSGQQQQGAFRGQGGSALLRVQGGKVQLDDRPARPAKPQLLFLIQHVLTRSFSHVTIVVIV